MVPWLRDGVHTPCFDLIFSFFFSLPLLLSLPCTTMMITPSWASPFLGRDGRGLPHVFVWRARGCHQRPGGNKVSTQPPGGFWRSCGGRLKNARVYLPPSSYNTE